MLMRKATDRFTLANLMRANLYASVAVLKIGNDILFNEEKVMVDRITGHGGLFKTPGVGQRVLAAAVVDNGFENWAALSALGTAGFEQYVAGGAAAVDKAIQGVFAVYNYIPLVAIILIGVLLIPFHLEKDLKTLRVQHGLNEDGSQKEI